MLWRWQSPCHRVVKSNGALSASRDQRQGLASVVVDRSGVENLEISDEVSGRQGNCICGCYLGG